MKQEEKLLREFIRNSIINESMSGIMNFMSQAAPYVDTIMSRFQAKSESDEDEDGEILGEEEEIIEEEIGRNHHTLDNNPFSWKDVDGVDVTTYASSDGSWSAKVECEDFPELSTRLTSFGDEAEAEHWARMQADKMIRNIMNKK